MTELFNTHDILFSDGAALARCAELLRSGGAVVFPTETVYGVAANGLDKNAVEKLYIAKNRPPVKPISLCVPNLEAARDVAVFDERAVKLFKAFMPGPLTLVLPKRDGVPDIVTARLDSVGIRVPADPIAAAVSTACGVPLALTSANLSGEPSPKDGAGVIKSMFGRVDAIIDGGSCTVGIESTIVSLTDGVKLLRAGAIDFAEVLQAL